MPEYVVAIIASAVLGWGGFTWRRAEQAQDSAERAADRVDKLEIKVAEQYLSKLEFQQRMDQLFVTLNRFEKKLDHMMLGYRHHRKDDDDD